jgi:hypothetical protein
MINQLTQYLSDSTNLTRDTHIISGWNLLAMDTDRTQQYPPRLTMNGWRRRAAVY